jgi:hypothetical protein
MKFITSAILSLSMIAAQSHVISADNQEQKTKTRKLRGGKPQQLVEEKASDPVDSALDSPTSQRLLDEEEFMAFDEGDLEASTYFDEEDTEAAAFEYTPGTIEYDEGELEAMYGPDEELAMEYGNEEAMMGLDTEEDPEYEMYMMGLLDAEEDGSSEDYDTYGEDALEYTPEKIEYDEGEFEAMYGPDEEEEELAMEYGSESIMGLDAEETPVYTVGEFEAMYAPDEEEEELAMEYGSEESIMGLDAEETPVYTGGEFEAMYGPDEDEELEMELEEEMMMGILDAEEDPDSPSSSSSED